MRLAALRTSSLRTFLSDIKLSHSVFALPFAIAGVLLCGASTPSIWRWICIIAAMVFARSFAMGANRYVDQIYDAKNPRTQQRALPAGKLKPDRALSFTLIFGLLFIGVSFGLNLNAGICSPIILGLLWSYSYCKRLSWICHYYLGFCLGLAPVAAAVALGVDPSQGIILLGIAIMLWVGGFDVLYATQDISFDRNEGLHSIPAKYGVKVSVLVSRVSFALAVFLFLIAGTMLGLSVIFRFGWFLIGLILFYEHWLIRDISAEGKTNGMEPAFFNSNAAVSLIFLAAVILDRWVYGG